MRLVRLSFVFTFKRLKRRVKTAALKLPWRAEATTEQKTNTLSARNIKDHIFRKKWIHASRHIIINTDGEEGAGKIRVRRVHWVTDVSVLLSTTWTLTLRNGHGRCHAMPKRLPVLDITREAFFVGMKKRKIPDLKLKRRQIAILESFGDLPRASGKRTRLTDPLAN